MYTSTVISLALIAAAIAPVSSVPIASLTPAEVDIYPVPFATDTPQQLQQIANEIHDAWVSVNPPVPVPTTNTPVKKRRTPLGAHFGAIGKGGAETAGKAGKDAAMHAVKSAAKRAAEPTPVVEPFLDPDHHFLGHGPVVLHDTEAMRRSIFGAIAEGIDKAAAKFGESQAKGAIQSALKRAPAPTPVAQPIHDNFSGMEGLSEHEKRQWGAIFGAIGKGAAEAASKIGKNEAKDAIKSAIKRAPAPTPA